MNEFLADENFPLPSFHHIRRSNVDIVHLGIDSPSINDREVIETAVTTASLFLRRELSKRSHLLSFDKL